MSRVARKKKKRARNRSVTQRFKLFNCVGVIGVGAHNSLKIKQFRGYVVICVT